jgi:hypothetical protein
MTLEELERTHINLDVAREAHTQSQKRLEDALATKAGHEQKAFALLAGFVTLAVALFGAAGVLWSNAAHVTAMALWLMGFAYSLAAMLAGVALLPQTYGAVGSDPSAWLRRGVIDSESQNALAATLAYETFFYGGRISASVRANYKKARLIRVAIITGLCAPPGLGLWIWLGAA